MFPKIAIIVLNWNGWEDTIECLESLFKINYPNYHLVVVDNASDDNSLDMINDYLQGKRKIHSHYFEYLRTDKPIHKTELNKDNIQNFKEEIPFNSPDGQKSLIIIKNDKNYGFAEGNNIAMEFVINTLKSEYLLLLNNDTVVDPEFLTHLMDTALKNENIGFVGPKTYYYNPKDLSNVISFAGGELSLLKCQPKPVGVDECDNGVHNLEKMVDYAEGSCLLVKTDMIKEIGLLDPEYFTYWEEVDWCVRGKVAGYTTMYSPKSFIWHKGYSSDLNARSVYMMIKNRFLFMKNNLNKYQKLGSLLYFYFYYFWILLFSFTVINRDKNKLSAHLRGTVDGTKILLK